MHLNNISLYHFKNYEQRSFQFDKKIIGITGLNGSGKTSILDAIYFLCFTKSYFLHSDAMAVKKNTEGMRIVGHVSGNTDTELVYILRENGKKEFLCKGEIYTQYSKHIGKFPCVFIAPDDTELISEGSELRRKYLDVLISQTHPNYMSFLIIYNKVLSQRNALLKKWLEISDAEKSLIEIYNEQLHDVGTKIFSIRKEVAVIIKQKINAIYQFISNEREEIDIVYSSRLHEHSLLDLLKQNSHKDIVTQRTNYGIHKDDLLFTMNAMPFKQVASQGQRKSFLFGMKLAEFEWLKENKSVAPFLLLDDVFEKLDEERSAKLIEYICKQDAQLFITDTHSERMQLAFKQYQDEFQLIELG